MPKMMQKPYKKKAWNDFMEQPCSSEAYIDPADAAETFIEFGIEQYEILSLMRYRTLAMWITCLCQAWEQQLIKFVIDEGRKSGIKYNPDCICNCFLID